MAKLGLPWLLFLMMCIHSDGQQDQPDMFKYVIGTQSFEEVWSNPTELTFAQGHRRTKCVIDFDAAEDFTHHRYRFEVQIFNFTTSSLWCAHGIDIYARIKGTDRNVALQEICSQSERHSTPFPITVISRNQNFILSYTTRHPVSTRLKLRLKARNIYTNGYPYLFVNVVARCFPLLPPNVVGLWKYEEWPNPAYFIFANDKPIMEETQII